MCYLEVKNRSIWQLHKIVQNDHDDVKICLYNIINIIIILNDKIHLPLSIIIACSICEWCAIQVTDTEANLRKLLLKKIYMQNKDFLSHIFKVRSAIF